MTETRLLFVLAALVELAAWVLIALRFRLPKPVAGETLLHYGFKLRVFALVVAFGIPLGLIYLMAATPIADIRGSTLIGATALAAGAIGGALLAETQGVHMLLTQAGIVSASPWRRRCELAWSAIVRVGYSKINQWMIVRAQGKPPIRASMHLVNIRQLAQLLRQRVAADRLAPAAKVLERLTR
jgi:hypothetical protein